MVTAAKVESGQSETIENQKCGYSNVFVLYDLVSTVLWCIQPPIPSRGTSFRMSLIV